MIDPQYLSEAELRSLHTSVIGRFGGIPGVRDGGALASCVAQPKTAVFGEERFPTIADKAAAYCYFIVRLHPFFDGNKRTGLVAAITFALDHGMAPRFDEDEMFDLILRLATGEAELEEVAAAFRHACE